MMLLMIMILMIKKNLDKQKAIQIVCFKQWNYDIKIQIVGFRQWDAVGRIFVFEFAVWNFYSKVQIMGCRQLDLDCLIGDLVIRLWVSDRNLEYGIQIVGSKLQYLDGYLDSLMEIDFQLLLLLLLLLMVLKLILLLLLFFFLIAKTNNNIVIIIIITAMLFAQWSSS